MAFVLKKRIDLSSFSDDWKECYLDFNSPTFEQISTLKETPKEEDKEEQINSVLGFVKEMFLGGKGFDGEKVIDVTAQDLDKLPVKILITCFNQLSGDIDPKGNET